MSCLLPPQDNHLDVAGRAMFRAVKPCAIPMRSEVFRQNSHLIANVQMNLDRTD